MKTRLKKLSIHKGLALRVFILLFIAGLLFWIFNWLNNSSVEQLEFRVQVADAFSKFAIGFGALATGFGGFSLIESWLKKQSIREEQKESLKEKWSKTYPTEKYGKTYRLIRDNSSPGILYIQDLPNGNKHWVTNPTTLRDLGLDYSQVVDIDSSDFKQIKSAGNINTVPIE